MMTNPYDRLADTIESMDDYPADEEKRAADVERLRSHPYAELARSFDGIGRELHKSSAALLRSSDTLRRLLRRVGRR